MSAPPPPKPWERAGGAATALAVSTPTPTSAAPTTQSTTVASSSTPSVPSRPSTITSAAATSSLTTPLASSSYSPYGASYTSPYNRLGSYGSPYGSTFGSSYGSPYGGYGGYSGYGGYGGYGGGMYGPGVGQPMDPNNPNAALHQLESSTAQAFALVQNIVGVFTGMAQMLDSTFMATHSSAFALIGVAHQFAQLRSMLSDAFGLFGFVGWLRAWWRGEKKGFGREDFKRFVRGESIPGEAKGPSRKPIIIFLIAVFGLPYLMNRLVRSLSSRLPPPPQPEEQMIDPSKCSFARAVYEFNSADPVELKLGKGELVVVLSTLDPVTGTEGEWWKGRTRDGREGWFPRSFVEIVRVKQAEDATPAPAAKVVA